MRARTRFEEEYFQSVLGGYGFDVLLPLFSSLADLLVRVSNPSVTLDIGCAKGFLCYCLESHGVEAFGVDISHYALHNSSQRVKGNLILSDVEHAHLPFKNDSFDLITMIETLPFLKNYTLVLDEIRRTLKEDGFCFITTPLSKSKVAKDPFYVNICDPEFWTEKLSYYGLKVIGDPRNNVFKEAIIDALKSCSPTTRLGKIVMRLGRIGIVVRSLLISIVEGQRMGAFLIRRKDCLDAINMHIE